MPRLISMPLWPSGRLERKPSSCWKSSPLQGAVVFLDDTRHREQVVVQLPAGRGHCLPQGRSEGTFAHSGSANLPEGSLRRCCTSQGRAEVCPCRTRTGLPLLLFLHLHLVNVGDFGLDGFYGGGLIDGLDMESNGHFRIHFQKLRQQLVRELRGQNLQVGGSAPSRPHPNSRLKRKSKLSGAIKSLVGSPVLGIISHENRKGEPLPGWSCP